MTRANRVYVPGHVWHITHRCHQKDFLLGHREDRRRWVYWLYQARCRYGLCVLNYIVTRNHIHLLVRDRGEREIAMSMQLVAGRTAQAHNKRMGRVHRELGGPSRDREVLQADGLTYLREPSVSYVLDTPPYVTQNHLNCVT